MKTKEFIKKITEVLKDSEEITVSELQMKIKGLLETAENSELQQIANDLRRKIISLSDNPYVSLSLPSAVCHLNKWLDKHTYDYGLHYQKEQFPPEEDDDTEREVPQHFHNLFDAQSKIVCEILKFAIAFNLNVYKILWEGEDICMEEYACAMLFTEYVDEMYFNLKEGGKLNFTSDKLEVTLGSCVAMVAFSFIQKRKQTYLRMISEL